QPNNYKMPSKKPKKRTLTKQEQDWKSYMEILREYKKTHTTPPKRAVTHPKSTTQLNNKKGDKNANT
ncbi:unnamed protein product, partial [marine sediment metagenome]